MTALLWTGALVILVGVAVAAWRARAGLWFQTAGVAAVGIAGGGMLLAHETYGSAFVNGTNAAFGVDPLSAFFLVVIGATAAPVLLFATTYVMQDRNARPIAMLTGLFVLALILVICARSISMFLSGWELMTLLPAATILAHDATRPARRAVAIYLGSTHLGGAGVWIAVLLLAHMGALSNPHLFAHQGEVLEVVVWAAALIGFGTKAGLMPMHSWLPRAHPIAPAHVSALMSGVMLKVALYGMIRVFFFWATPVPAWIATIVLAFGVVSSLGGVIYALFEHDLKRLLAFSSIENIGIITLGLGAALLFMSAHQNLWGAIAFAAALFHIFNHAIFKGLLFLGSGAIERTVRGRSIDHLGGLLTSMPWTAWAFIIGCMAIAGLPLLNGFVSEWITLQSLLHLALNNAGVPIAGVVAAASLAATAALAVMCFTKVIGLVLLGPSRQRTSATVTDVSLEMRVAQGALAAICIVVGLIPGTLFPILMSDVQAVPYRSGINLALPATGGIPMVNVIILLFLVAGPLFLLRRRSAVSSAPTWVCGQDVVSTLNWTSSAFTKPLRLSLEWLLRPKSSFTVVRARGIVQSARYHGEVPQLIDTRLYQPVIHTSLKLARSMRKMQSGRIHSYAVYLAGTVVLLLLLGRLGILS